MIAAIAGGQRHCHCITHHVADLVGYDAFATVGQGEALIPPTADEAARRTDGRTDHIISDVLIFWEEGRMCVVASRQREELPNYLLSRRATRSKRHVTGHRR